MNRKSYIEHYSLCFWTATINNWQPLFNNDRYKEVVAGSLHHLSKNNKVDVFAFVIMPTHIHLLWLVKDMNGRESPQGSFLKFTAHQFKQMLKQEGDDALANYRKNCRNKQYEFWQCNPLAIRVNTTASAMNILDYIHNNPLSKKWQLCTAPEEYKFSSAAYYIHNDNQFPFLKNIWEVL